MPRSMHTLFHTGVVLADMWVYGQPFYRLRNNGTSIRPLPTLRIAKATSLAFNYGVQDATGITLWRSEAWDENAGSGAWVWGILYQCTCYLAFGSWPNVVEALLSGEDGIIRKRYHGVSIDMW